MAASKSKVQPTTKPFENFPPDQKPVKTRTKFRKPKGEVALLQPQPDLPPEPGPSSETVAEIEDIWSWTSLADSSASTHPAVFTKDGRYVLKQSDHFPRHPQCTTSRYFFSIIGSSVKIHASSTGHVVSTLSVATVGGSTSRSDGGHTAKITSALLNPHNPFQLITASLDGCIKFWDYLDGTLLQTFRLPQPIFMIAAHDKVKDYIFAVTSRGTKRQTAGGMCL
jgi:NET1-associated nuclear protein 1 (U3 small nucleolar RNA-associated protein 17)